MDYRKHLRYELDGLGGFDYSNFERENVEEDAPPVGSVLCGSPDWGRVPALDTGNHGQGRSSTGYVHLGGDWLLTVLSDGAVPALASLS